MVVQIYKTADIIVIAEYTDQLPFQNDKRVFKICAISYGTSVYSFKM